MPQVPENYLVAYGVSPLVTQLLYNRGVGVDKVASFLSEEDECANSSFLLPDIEPAVSRIYRALRSGEKIAVYGDFDADGITATVILMECLSWLGAVAVSYLPDRCKEGHGLSLSGIEELHRQGVGLLITVDCGSSDCEEVARAGEMGMDVIITDHHVPERTLPRAVAVVNPKREDSRYPFPDLAGVGVAFKLVQALLYRHSKEASLHEFLDLVALGTVTDMVPLVGENRCLVKAGMKVLNNTRCIGLREMIDVARLKLGHINTEQISWTLGPRINSASRVGNAAASYDLLVTRSLEEARRLARALEDKNTERQRATEEALAKAEEGLTGRTHLPLLIEGSESYSVGTIGLVSGRLVEEFSRPAIMLHLGPEICRGSCRSIPEFSILSALEECRDLLVSFGGHHMAAGFTIVRQNLAEFEERIMKVATDRIGHLDLSPKLVIDAEVPLSVFDSNTLNLIQRIGPFGKGNPVPVFLTRGIEVVAARTLGDHGKHLGLRVRQDGVVWKAVVFNSKVSSEEMPSCMDAVYNMEKDWWNGEEVLRLNILDFAPV